MSFDYEKKEQLQGLLAIFVEDTIAAGNPAFKMLTDEIPKTLKSKTRKYSPFIFAGININRTQAGYLLEKMSTHKKWAH